MIATRARRLALVSPLLLASNGLAQTWTEEQVLELFNRQSPQAVAARAQVAVTRAEARGRALYSNPSFSYSREGAGYTEFFQAEQALPLTGRIRLLRQSINPATAAAEAGAAALVWRLRSEVRSAFYALLASQRREQVLNDTIADLGEVIRVLTAREKEGEGTRFDRLRWERELVELGAELSSMAANSAKAKALLLEFLPPGTEISAVEGTLIPFEKEPPVEIPSAEVLLSKALASRSEIRAANHLLAKLQIEQQAAGRLRYPEPTVAGGLKRADVSAISPGGTLIDRAQNGLFLGVTIPIPSFNRGQAEVSLLQAEQARVEAQRRAVEHEIRAQVNGAYATLLLRRAALTKYRQELGGRNEELLKIVRTAYQEGAAGILELLDVFRLQRQSQQRVIELGTAVREAQLELERALGQEVTK
ncbi:MAG: TolC family protein [Paludibaculum sp.]